MSVDKIEITLLKADADSQDELKRFAESLRAAGVQFSTRARTADSIGVETIILAFVLKVAPEIVRALAVSLVAWMKGRNGRRIRFRFDDIEVEAPSVEELNAILDRAEELSRHRDK